MIVVLFAPASKVTLPVATILFVPNVPDKSSVAPLKEAVATLSVPVGVTVPLKLAFSKLALFSEVSVPAVCVKVPPIDALAAKWMVPLFCVTLPSPEIEPAMVIVSLLLTEKVSTPPVFTLNKPSRLMLPCPLMVTSLSPKFMVSRSE
ncbi:hypothetical protein [Parabacteroides sp. PH5-33]|uniref:hypothetical protein n=1 Tax=Parabacteroides sp. PH5-33 TaxID=1742407 RepID=UPI0024743D3B|nr:hypothetical protein [Parabacteroides sp. PH5-33]